MNRSEARWVIFIGLFAFLPLLLLLNPNIEGATNHPTDPVLLFVLAQLCLLGINFSLMGLKALAFKYYHWREHISVVMIALAFAPILLAALNSMNIIEQYLPQEPVFFAVLTAAVLGVSAMFVARGLEVWNRPTSVLKRYARIKGELTT